MYQCFVEVSTGTGFYSSAFLLVVVFCGDFNLLQREVSLMRDGN